MVTTNSQLTLDGPSTMGNCQVRWRVNNGYIPLNHVFRQVMHCLCLCPPLILLDPSERSSYGASQVVRSSQESIWKSCTSSECGTADWESSTSIESLDMFWRVNFIRITPILKCNVKRVQQLWNRFEMSGETQIAVPKSAVPNSTRLESNRTCSGWY